MLDGLDVFRLYPMTTREHAVAFAIYAALIGGAAFAARAGWGWCRKALVSRKRRADGLGLAEPRP